MNELQFFVMRGEKTEEKQGVKQLYVSSEHHNAIRAISRKSGIPMYEVTKRIIDYALENIVWVEE